MNTIQLPTGLNVPVSAAYPNNWDVQQAISDVYNSFGVMTYCKPKTLRKFGETLNADNGADTTVAKFQGSVINETFSTTNDITHVVSDDDIPVKGFVNGFLLNDITDPNSSLSVDLKNKILTSMKNPN